jgi:membrane-associated protease RseP (regulator of RpoE activity)
MINVSVAVVNMLPLGVFDGGRVFYLTALAITKSKKKAAWLFKAVTFIILLLLLLLTVLWWLAL